ncbi:unnamed protein product [Rhodiola kirilowii]
MFRQAAARLVVRSTKARPFSTDLSAASSGDASFIEGWKKVIPNMDPPKTPSTFMKPRPAAPSTVPSKLTVNFVLPYASELTAKEVDMVMVPSSTGQLGVLPGHVPTIAELKPGLLSVHEGNDVKKYFISSGFAFVHANSITDIIAVEAVPLEQIDPSLVQKGLAEFNQKLSSASTDLERAEAQIGVELHTAMTNVLAG